MPPRDRLLVGAEMSREAGAFLQRCSQLIHCQRNLFRRVLFWAVRSVWGRSARGVLVVARRW